MARCGWMPRAFSACVRPATSARIFRASALPSRTCAAMRSGGRGGRLGRVLAQCDLEQVGDGIGVELFHDVGAVRLHRLDADAQVVGDLLVEAAGDDSLENLSF